MCGIAGYAILKEGSPVPDLERMTGLLAHRGPDDEGVLETGDAGLGMRRLAVIDLETGHQPMFSEDRSVAVIANGEIYNFRELRGELEGKGHRFATRSDTEVLVHGYEEWGDGLPLRLRGMFAFALRDEGRGRILLARDHFGVKPLYWTETDGRLLFASEMKSLLAEPSVSREVDHAALDAYLSFLYVPEPATIYRRIRALPPAHLMVIEKGGWRIGPYWSFRFEPRTRSPEEAAEAVAAALDDSVRAMLVSDVPLGLFLSGGLDSAAILAFMRRHETGTIRSFTIGFGGRERHWNEFEAARSLARGFETEHHEFLVDPRIVDLAPKILRHFDQPFANPTAVILHLLSKETANHVKVVLAGTGGDEMLGGYPRYLGMQAYLCYGRLPAGLRRGAGRLARLLRDSSDGRLGRQRLRRFLEAGALSFPECYRSLVSAMDETRKKKLYTPFFLERLGEEGRLDSLDTHLGNREAEPLERLMAADVNSYLPFNQLVYGDRMSMASSLETRVPFVDQEFAEVAGSIPLGLKLEGGRTKGLFRRAMKGILPKERLSAPKRGLNLPISLWFRGELREWLTDLLRPSSINMRGYLKGEAVSVIIQEHLQGKRDHSLFLWALVMLELWHQEYLDDARGGGA